MRDLGLMGESTFSLWCNQAGLIPNGSQIDKTGWDFFVEFPFSLNESAIGIHKAASECKVQVKSTDKNDRKLSITLSNLRRLITAQMPAFFVFFEFDGKDSAQRAFIVHVDNDLITKVLTRLHTIEQSDEENNFNKRTMTIHYDESHSLENLNGECLKSTFLDYIGSDLSKYIANKNSHLEATGFENGFAQMTFSTEGTESLKNLIDASLGIEKQVNITGIKGVHTRFGISSKSPFVEFTEGKITIPNLKPRATGIVKFKEEKLSSGISFNSKLFISPFNVAAPDEYKKFRVEGDFFDLIFNPYTGRASYSFSFGEGVRLSIRKFRDAIKLLSLLSSSDKILYAEMIFNGYPKLEFDVKGKEYKFNFHKELECLECAVSLMSAFDVSDHVDISFDEASRYSTQICQMHKMLVCPANLFEVDFGVENDNLDVSTKVACIFIVTAPIGSHIFGMIMVLTGSVKAIENYRYKLEPNNVQIERKIISEKDKSVLNEDLLTLLNSVGEKYVDDYSVIRMYD